MAPPVDPTQRFSGRVENYTRYRPGYPGEVLHILHDEAGLSAASVVADVGSGTGISTKLFLDNGNVVYAVEPNREMREAAEASLGNYPSFHSVAATAEATTLPDAAVDFVVAGQAFHWFCVEEARREFRRILRPEGWAVLMWNSRRTDTTPFLRGYEALLAKFGTDYREVNHTNIGDDVLRSFFDGTPEYRRLENVQVFDYAGLEGRLLSSSYVPSADDRAVPADAGGPRRALCSAARRGARAVRVRHRAVLWQALTNTMHAESAALVPGDHTRTLQVDGRTRTYLVHVPPSYHGAKPVPLVLAFHGGATDAAFMSRFCGLNDKADQAGFIVVYPNGTGEFPRLLTWNAGSCCGFARRHQVDDVSFTRAILEDMASVAAVDGKRVFATGISNGGMMAYRLAAELADRISAVAPVAGTLCLDAPRPVRPVSVIHFHGTLDEFVPIAGGRGPRSMSQADFLPVDEAIRTWVEINGCRREPIITELPKTADDRMTVVRQEYAARRDGTSVVLYVIHGGGHTWPGRSTRIAMLGPSTLNISANDLLWEFFEKHPMS